MKITIFLSLLLVIFMMLSPLVSVRGAALNNVVVHTFGFDASETPGNACVEILDFRYGDSNTPGTYAEKERVAMGHISQGGGGGVTGGMPLGHFLYVKWRALASGKIYEDRIDLENRRPDDMNSKIIHFTFRCEQLNVYVIEGTTSAQLHAPTAPNCPVWSYGPFQCKRVYPDSWRNF
jgi:hypothetical protein